MHFLKEGDEIIVGIGEHHSNFLPWQQVGRATGAKVIFFECDPDGTYDPDRLRSLVNDRTKLLAITQVSNVFGRINPIREFARIVHEKGAVIVADGAQSVPHMVIDVKDLDVDFFAFSGHKMYAPMGIGVLYTKKEILENMDPFLYGGEMIEYVTTEGATYAEVPHKFEAGTVNAGGAAGLSKAIDFINDIGFDYIEKRESYLSELMMTELRKIPHVNIIGDDNPSNHHGIVTFTVDDVHPHDIAAILDSDKIAVRAGHHCAQPLLKYLGVMSTARASMAVYNNSDDVMRFAESVKSLRKRLGYN
jgi:cysteine desulfurase/selenocysteine lyase